MKKFTFNWRLNHQIRTPEVRLIGADGKQLGVVKTEEAISKAQKEGLDLVEIAPNAKPPVAKIVDIGKFRYEEEKKLKKQKKASKGTDVKEVRFSPFIADHDFETHLEKVKEFLSEKNKIRLVVVFKGSQMGSKQFGYNILNKIKLDLKDSIVEDMEPKFFGRHLISIISPLNQPKKSEGTEK